MALKLSTIQVQKPILAPSLQQSIAVLLLPVMELEATIEQELQSNPLLEFDETHPDHLGSAQNERIYEGLERLNKHRDAINRTENADDQEEKPNQFITRTETLEDHLLQQLRLETSDPLQLRIGELIIGNLDIDGYLQASCAEIAQTLGLPGTEPVEKVLSIIQKFEPLGIASRNLSECLLIQLKDQKDLYVNLAARIARDHLKELGRKKYLEIARKLKASVEDIKEASRVIARLEPKPARNSRPVDNNIYVKPDVFIKADKDNGYKIIINRAETPPLRINPLYRELLKNPKITPEEKLFLQEKLTNAINFIKSIGQRGQTIRKITEYILNHQKNFFVNGTMTIAPMCLKDVATSLNRCESTISRAISNKYIDTPKGVYPMKFFFSQAVPSSADTEEGSAPTSVQGIKEEIKEMVEQENKTHPLSDHNIQRHFAGKGVSLARRTISKYRQALDIPPSYLRKE